MCYACFTKFTSKVACVDEDGNELTPDFVSQVIKKQRAKKTVLTVSTEIQKFTDAGGISRCKCHVITCMKQKRDAYYKEHQALINNGATQVTGSYD